MPARVAVRCAHTGLRAVICGPPLPYSSGREHIKVLLPRVCSEARPTSGTSGAAESERCPPRDA